LLFWILTGVNRKLNRIGALICILSESLLLPEGNFLKILFKFLYLYPTYGLHLALEGGIILKCVREQSCPGFMDIFNGSNITIGLGLMIVHSIILMILAYFIETKKKNLIIFRPFFYFWKKFYNIYNSPNPINENEDDDVKSERISINNNEHTNSKLLIKNLSKNYDKN
jgi:hypothetical protein